MSLPQKIDRCLHRALQWLNNLIIVFILLGTQVDKKLTELDTHFFEEELKQFSLFDLEKKKGKLFVVGYQHW